MDSWIPTVMYSLGAIGLFGITLLPLRGYSLLRRWSLPLWQASIAGKLLLTVTVVLVLGALVFEFQLLSRVFNCLLGERCGPKRASGLGFTAAIGFWYLCFEAARLVIVLLARWLIGTGARPNNSFKPTPLRGAA
ncbi:hypothetical protein [Thermomonas brevis]